MDDPDRRTGRTTRLLQYALDQRRKNPQKRILLVFDTRVQADNAYVMARELAEKLGLPFGTTNDVLHGIHFTTPSLVEQLKLGTRAEEWWDHHAIDTRVALVQEQIDKLYGEIRELQAKPTFR